MGRFERASTGEASLPRGPRGKRGFRALAWLVPPLLAGFFLSLRIAAVWPEVDVVWAEGHRRFWEDLQVASGYFLRGEFPVYCNDVVKERGPEGIRYTERYPQVSRSVQEAGIEPWQFWRTVSSRRFLRRMEGKVSKRFDDAGRPLLLGLAFRAMGGIAPFLLLWISFLLLVPVLVWIAWEFRARGDPWAGAAFLLCTGPSAYVAENLALPYSPSGFYIVSLYVLVGFTAYATAPGRGLGPGHWLRVIGAGGWFALCVLGRGGALLQAGGFALAIALAVWRRVERPPGRSSATRLIPLLTLSLGLFFLPYAAGRFAVGQMTAATLARHGQTGAPQQHALWFGIWGGLGDFDEEKGHIWSDFATWDAILRAGGTPTTPTYYDPANEVVLRRLVLGEIAQDPAWFARILAHRLWATLAQPKLWPWGPTSGRSIAPAQRMNEGVVDSYYALTSTADWFGVGGRVMEIPVPLLVLPTFAFLVFSWPRRRHEAWPLAPLFAAVLPLPVIVTTASALEAQAVLVAYMLGAALLVQSLLRVRRDGVVTVPGAGEDKTGAGSPASVVVPLTSGSGLEG